MRPWMVFVGTGQVCGYLVQLLLYVLWGLCLMVFRMGCVFLRLQVIFALLWGLWVLWGSGQVWGYDSMLWCFCLGLNLPWVYVCLAWLCCLQIIYFCDIGAWLNQFFQLSIFSFVLLSSFSWSLAPNIYSNLGIFLDPSCWVVLQSFLALFYFW